MRTILRVELFLEGKMRSSQGNTHAHNEAMRKQKNLKRKRIKEERRQRRHRHD